MPEPIFQRVVDRFTPTSGAELVYELPAFALSYLNIAVIRQQTTANDPFTITSLTDFLTRVTVAARGATIYDLTGEEMFVLGTVLYAKNIPYRKALLSDATARHIANIFVPFSRKPLMPNSGLKPIERGNLLLTIRTGTVPANTWLSIHAIGWREHTPDWTVRCVRQVQTIAATGDNDVILAPAGPYLGFGFYELNPFITATTGILQNLRLLIQGVEDTLMSVNYEAIVGETFLNAMSLFNLADHEHVENIAAAYTQNVLTRAQQVPTVLNRYAYILLDEYFDADTVVAVPPGVDVRLRVAATATGELRVFPIEMFVIPERVERAA